MSDEQYWVKRASAGQLKELQEQLGELWQIAETIQVPLEFDRRMRTRWAANYVFSAMKLIQDANEQIEALLADETEWRV